MLKHVVVGFFSLLLIGSTQAQAVKVGDLVIEHSHARATKGNMSNSASFLQIANKGKVDDALLSASVAIAERVELHTMSMEGDVMKMRAIDSIDLKAGNTISMKPGQGPHVMLFGLKKPLKVGDRFPLTLNFRKAGAVEVSVEVMDIAAHGKHGSGHAHQEHKH
jgi:copper(I)-binding protein